MEKVVVVITRHPGLVDLLREIGLADKDAVVIHNESAGCDVFTLATPVQRRRNHAEPLQAVPAIPVISLPKGEQKHG